MTNMFSLLRQIPAKRTLAGAAGLGAAALLAAALLPGQADQPEAGQGASLPVRVEQALPADGLTTRHFAGRVEAVSTVDLSFEVGGRLTEMPVMQGRLLPEGALLAALDPADYELALREAEVQRDLAAKEFERYRSLLQRDNVSRAAYDRAEADLRMKRVAFDRAQRNLDYTRLEAPFDALITRRHIDNFSAVQPKQNVVRVQNVTELHIDISVPEHLIGLTAEPDRFEAAAYFPSAPDTSVPLSYREHETEPDPVTQTYRVTFAMKRPDDLSILPGMTASVAVRLTNGPQGRAGAGALEIPLSAIDNDAQGGARVWVVDAETGTARPRAVTLDHVENGRAIVRGGLAGGEQVISAGTRFLHEGARVHPAENF